MAWRVDTIGEAEAKCNEGGELSEDDTCGENESGSS